MLSRTKVNYRWHDLGRALVRSERGSSSRDHLTASLARYQQANHVLLTPSGRAGLYYLLRATDRPRLVVPGYTCKAVTEAALLAGKQVVQIDVDDGFNLSAAALAGELDDQTVVIATHQFGIPCQIEEICALAKCHGALVFEDVAAALGSRVNGKLAGTFGDAAFFSFDSTKLVHVPLKAGFVTAKDPALFARACEVHDRETAPMAATRKFALLAQAAMLLGIEQPHLYRVFHKLMFEWRGRFTADDAIVRPNKTPFYTDRIAEWQAMIAVPQIERLDDLVARRRSLYDGLRRRLAGCRAIELPPTDERHEWACIRFPVLVRDDKAAYYRAAAARGIDFAFSFSFLAGDPALVPEAHRIASRILDLPYYEKLTEADLNSLTGVLRDLERNDTLSVSSLRGMFVNRLRREDVYSSADYWNQKAIELDGHSISMWANNHLNALYHDEQTAVIDRLLPDLNGKRVLDVGCGTGRLSRYAASRGAIVRGIDFASRAIELANQGGDGPNPTYAVQSMFELEDCEQYDVVLSWGSVAFAPRNPGELDDALLRFARALRPGGEILLLEPVHRGLLHRVLDMGIDDFTAHMATSGFDVREIADMHFWPARLALAFLQLPRSVTQPVYRAGQHLMKRWFPRAGDYKAIYGVRR